MFSVLAHIGIGAKSQAIRRLDAEQRHRAVPCACNNDLPVVSRLLASSAALRPPAAAAAAMTLRPDSHDAAASTPCFLQRRATTPRAGAVQPETRRLIKTCRDPVHRCPAAGCSGRYWRGRHPGKVMTCIGNAEFLSKVHRLRFRRACHGLRRIKTVIKRVRPSAYSRPEPTARAFELETLRASNRCRRCQSGWRSTR